MFYLKLNGKYVKRISKREYELVNAPDQATCFDEWTDMVQWKARMAPHLDSAKEIKGKEIIEELCGIMREVMKDFNEKMNPNIRF